MLYRALWLAMFLLFPFAGVVHADTIPLACKSEEAMNSVADAYSKGGDNAANIVLEPYLALGECFIFNEQLFVYVVHKGSVFGEITVVGVARKIGDFPDMWGMMLSKEINEQVGSI